MDHLIRFFFWRFFFGKKCINLLALLTHNKKSQQCGSYCTITQHMQIIPAILSSGSGTRLWPLSRKQYPKQYLPLMSDNTMLQETILRLNGLDGLAVEPHFTLHIRHSLKK